MESEGAGCALDLTCREAEVVLERNSLIQIDTKNSLIERDSLLAEDISYQIKPAKRVQPLKVTTAQPESKHYKDSCRKSVSKSCISTNGHVKSINHRAEKTEKRNNFYRLQCTECNYLGINASRLETHTRVHTGEKPYLCTQCGAKFNQNSSLNAHMKRHAGEKPFRCTECDSRFGKRCNLKTHMFQHTGDKPYRCTLCESKFSRKRHVQIHMVRHTKEKPYVCVDCGATFAHKNSLTDHKVIHTGARSYLCVECEAVFHHKRSLNRHMLKHTG